MTLQLLTAQALAHYQKGELAEAAGLYLQILEADPASFIACHQLGIIRARQGRNAEALDLIGAALKIDPQSPEALSNYGNMLKLFGRLDEALASFDKALALKPDYAVGFFNRGNTLRELKRLEDALMSYDRAVALRPDYAAAFFGRGMTQAALHRYEDALESYNRLLAIAPDHVQALNNRGIALQRLNRLEAALASYDRALAYKPGVAEVLTNRARTLAGLQRFDESLETYKAALAIDPANADALSNQAAILRYLKRPREALAAYDQALAADPGHPYAFGGAADAALHLCDWARTEKFAAEIPAHIAAGRSVVSLLTLLGYSDDASLQLQCARRNVRELIPVQPPPLWDGKPWRNDKIKVAYLSADFHTHATANLMAGLFERHDRSSFETLAISFGPDDNSQMRARLVRAFDGFHDVRGQNDYDVARFLHANKVDIAIDLKGHTQDARLGILSHRPCPVQVQFLGYPGTLGADFIDYVIADKIVAPFDQQRFFAEQIVHLPDCYQVNDSSRIIAAIPSRADAGLPEQGFVFCCFNNSWKITAPLFDIWMRLLAGAPGSVLWLIGDNEEACANLRKAAAARGIDPVRLIFAARTPIEAHLARHQLADLFLDTLPYNAHTTASDALWAGLPLVTCMGRSFASRVAASVLRAAGLPELVTENLAAYETLAQSLVQDAARLHSFRQRLAENRLNCPLFDTELFRRNIESAYRAMWEMSQRGEAPRAFSVDQAQ